MEWFHVKWRFESCLTIDCVGKSGGLALLWTKDINLEVCSYSNYHIGCVIHDDVLGMDWRFTGFYRKPETSRRQVGGSLRPQRQMRDFHEAIVDCGFLKLPVEGPLLTWSDFGNVQGSIKVKKNQLKDLMCSIGYLRLRQRSRLVEMSCVNLKKLRKCYGSRVVVDNGEAIMDQAAIGRG
ncbi:hypothetical protein PTKIN_Ptkin16aG0080000 [Pterospermum kingtungense]